MKNFQLILLLCFVSVAKIYGQGGRIVVEITKEKHKTYTTKVIQSVIADSSLVRSLEEKINRFIPVKNRVKKGIYIVSVNFIVAKDGGIVDIECKNDPGFELCAEVVRTLKKYQRWAPGELRMRQ